MARTIPHTATCALGGTKEQSFRALDVSNGIQPMKQTYDHRPSLIFHARYRFNNTVSVNGLITSYFARRKAYSDGLLERFVSLYSLLE